MESIKVGIIGCGNIAPAYIKGCRGFSILDLTACADVDMTKAAALADQYGLQACSVEELLADPTINIVINLTIPAVHAEISLRIIRAGKHVHSEKPLAIHRSDGGKILEAAKSAGVRVGCAPDTFLGGGLQTCRRIIDEGWIGTPVAATAFMMSHGPESWHPNPEFFYKPGGGPLLDMGPYYLTALIHLLGSIRRVTAVTRVSFPTRTATSKERSGEQISVEVPTHVAGVLDFSAGPVATLITSFDVWQHNLPRIEIYGSEGSLLVPDPNTFRGPVQVWLAKEKQWREVPLMYSDNVGRGIGVADLAYSVISGRANRASGEVAYHVLDAMLALEEASNSGQHIELTSQCPQPVPLPQGLADGELDR